MSEDDGHFIAFIVTVTPVLHTFRQKVQTQYALNMSLGEKILKYFINFKDSPQARCTFLI